MCVCARVHELQNVKYGNHIRCFHMTLVEVARLAREQTQMNTNEIRDKMNTNDSPFIFFVVP